MSPDRQNAIAAAEAAAQNRGMKRIAAAAAILGAAAVSAALAFAGSHGHAPSRSVASTNVAERAFVRWLVKHHPGFQGPSVCPSSSDVRQNNGGIICLGEIHKGERYVQVWAKASVGGEVVFRHVATRSWTRHWSKYSPQQVSPGLISVNTTLSPYDWRWLVLGVDYLCRQQDHRSCTASALDGQLVGYDLFFTFSCHNEGNLITCRNKLGDALRWLPPGLSPAALLDWNIDALVRDTFGQSKACLRRSYIVVRERSTYCSTFYTPLFPQARGSAFALIRLRHDPLAGINVVPVRFYGRSGPYVECGTPHHWLALTNARTQQWPVACVRSGG